jgi:hypothetical protein
MRNANWHPTETELALFLAEGGPDREEIASHLDACRRCAQVIVLSQQAAFQADLVPQEAMSPALRASRVALMKKAIHEGLRPTTESENAPKKVLERQPSPNSKPAGPASNSQWGLLGGLGALGGWLMGESFGAPIPALGEKDKSLPRSDNLEDSAADEAEPQEDSRRPAEDAAATEPLPPDGGGADSDASDLEQFSVMDPDDVESSSEDVWRGSVDRSAADPYADINLPGIDPPPSDIDGGVLDPGELEADERDPDELDPNELDSGESFDSFDDQP